VCVRKKIAKYIQGTRALRLTHKKISSTSGAGPRPETVQSDRTQERRINTELAGSGASKEVRRREEEASSVKIIHNFLSSMTWNSTVMHILSNVAMTREH
jgi:hypothetical protein